jgi:hypothetical protein
MSNGCGEGKNSYASNSRDTALEFYMPPKLYRFSDCTGRRGFGPHRAPLPRSSRRVFLLLLPENHAHSKAQGCPVPFCTDAQLLRESTMFL